MIQQFFSATLQLYHVDGSMQLAEERRIQCIFDEALGLVQLGHSLLDRDLDIQNVYNVEPLIRTLKHMDSLFGTCLINTGSQELNGRLPVSIEVPYTDTEEAWLQYQFKLLQSQNQSVTLPNVFLEEYITLLSRYYNIFLEKY